jgi:5'-3' exonuclease
MVHRAKHAVSNKMTSRTVFDPFGDPVDLDQPDKDRIGLITTVVFNGILNSYNKFGCDHCVATFDLRSWRKDFYEEYKAHRDKKIKTPAEVDEEKLIIDVIDEIKIFLRDYTNVTVLEATGAEADDFIARWVQLHYEDDFEHVIVSSDNDFKQLVSDNTIQYNQMSRTIFTTDGVFHQDKNKSKKIEKRVELYGETWYEKVDKKDVIETFDPEWELFFKCIRGDSSDNIKTAWPRVYESKMRAAYNGTVEEYNNFINSTWGDDDNKHSVRELYERNKILIDLTSQPNEVKLIMDEAIVQALDMKSGRFIGAHFANFCSRYQLVKLIQQADRFTTMLSKKYSE